MLEHNRRDVRHSYMGIYKGMNSQPKKNQENQSRNKQVNSGRGAVQVQVIERTPAAHPINLGAVIGFLFADQPGCKRQRPGQPAQRAQGKSPRTQYCWRSRDIPHQVRRPVTVRHRDRGAKRVVVGTYLANHG